MKKAAEEIKASPQHISKPDPASDIAGRRSFGLLRLPDGFEEEGANVIRMREEGLLANFNPPKKQRKRRDHEIPTDTGVQLMMDEFQQSGMGIEDEDKNIKYT